MSKSSSIPKYQENKNALNRVAIHLNVGRSKRQNPGA